MLGSHQVLVMDEPMQKDAEVEELMHDWVGPLYGVGWCGLRAEELQAGILFLLAKVVP